MSTAPTRVGPYEIVAPLGAGGMGEVYRARDSRLGRDVALKLLPPEFANDADRLARFELEAKAVAALAHPNILVLYDFGTDRGVSYAATELLEGETLRQRLKPAALPWRKAVEIDVAIADGLAAAHAKGIIHRDLKPDNVFITSDERVKILDFGLAKVSALPVAEGAATRSYSPSPTKTGTVLGTAPYMSPEQLRGQPVDARSDFFSFGCLLYEMLAGQRPFQGNTDAELVAAILHDDPPELTQSGKRIPVEMQRLVRRCLEKNPEARFQSARDLAFALRSTVSESGAVEAPLPPTGSRRTRLAVGVGAVVLLAALGAAGLHFFNRAGRTSDAGKSAGESKAIEAIAVLPFVHAGKEPETEYLGDMIPGTIIKSLLELQHLRVRPFSSVAPYNGRQKGLDLREVGRDLQVQAVVTGTVVPRKDGLLVSVELVDVRDNRLLWSEQYDRKLADLQGTQAEIAKQICAKLRVQLTGNEENRLGKRYTENSEAYLLYLEGVHWMRKWTTESFKRSIDCLDRAEEMDPSNALAHSARAEAYCTASWSYLLPAEALPKAKQAAETAVQIDDELAEAHTALSLAKLFCDWDWAGAEREAMRALQLNPRNAMAHDSYGWYLVDVGRADEALEQMKQAAQLEPHSITISGDMAWLLFFSRRYDEAIQQGRRTLALDPNAVDMLDALSNLYAQKGDFPAAIATAERIKPWDEALATSILGWIAARTGKRAEALESLNTLDRLFAQQRHIPTPPPWRALLYASLGENERALDWLEKAVDERPPFVVWITVHPALDRLRSDPRFAQLLKKMNLPP